ncbi:MAG: hypothetical protein AAGB14_02740 [Verrucomicrobiota bacterium]
MSCPRTSFVVVVVFAMGINRKIDASLRLVINKQDEIGGWPGGGAAALIA